MVSLNLTKSGDEFLTICQGIGFWSLSLFAEHFVSFSHCLLTVSSQCLVTIPWPCLSRVQVVEISILSDLIEQSVFNASDDPHNITVVTHYIVKPSSFESFHFLNPAKSNKYRRIAIPTEWMIAHLIHTFMFSVWTHFAMGLLHIGYVYLAGIDRLSVPGSYRLVLLWMSCCCIWQKTLQKEAFHVHLKK